MKELEREILIIGAGPAGISAAIEAAKAGAKVTVADEHDTIGGQLYKQIHKFFGAADNHAGMRGFEIARKLEQEAKELGVEFWLNTVAYGIFKEGVGIVRDGDNFIVKAKKVIVAAGGIENTTAFPGSTLPGVMLAGAAQNMTNIHRVLPGKRMVVVGSGNVGLIVAYQMLQAGAEVLAVVERDDHIGGYGVHAEKIRTAGVPILTDTIIKCASGKTSVEGVTTVKLGSDGAEIAGSRRYAVFIQIAVIKPGGKAIPYAAALFHRRFRRIPAVEVADERNALSVRRPDCKSVHFYLVHISAAEQQPRLLRAAGVEKKNIVCRNIFIYKLRIVHISTPNK